MSDPIKDYARAVANLAWHTGHQNDAMPTLADLDAIIEAVARELHHHDAPTCDGWWWAYGEGGWQALCIETFDDGTMSCLMCGTEANPRDYDKWVRLLPPDTTTPAPQDDEHHDCHWRRLDDARREDKVVQNAAPDVQAQIDAADDWVCPKHGCAVCEECAIDAAVSAYRQDMHECEQIAGRALGYPRYADDQKNFPDATDADGVCVGEHVAPTIVAELAEKYRAAMSENEHWRTTAKDRISTALADEMVREAVAREREECARVAEWVWDSGNQGAHGGEQANRTTAAIRARSAKGE